MYVESGETFQFMPDKYYQEIDLIKWKKSVVSKTTFPRLSRLGSKVLGDTEFDY